MKWILPGAVLTALAVSAIEVPGFSPVDSTLVENGELQLPDVGGSIHVPNRNFEWYAGSPNPDVKSFMVEDPVSGRRILMRIVLNIAVRDDADFNKWYGAVLTGVRSGFSDAGGTIENEATQYIDIPPHPKIRTQVTTAKLPGGTTTLFTCCIPTGRHVIIFQDSPLDGNLSPELQAMIGSLKYVKQTPLSAAAPPVSGIFNLSSLRLFGVLFVVALIAAIVSWLARRASGMSSRKSPFSG